MNIVHAVDRNVLRRIVDFLIGASLCCALFVSNADAAMNPYFQPEALDTCPDVTEVRVRSGWWIDAVQLVCRDRYFPQRGGYGGGLRIFRLHPGERITAISGTRIGPAGEYVYALQFHTNFRSSPVFGQAGPQRGQIPFYQSVPQAHRFVGFSTRSGQFVHSISLQSAWLPPARPAKHVFQDDCRNVSEVHIRAGWWIDAVQLVCRDQVKPQRGGMGGGLHVFRLQPGERIVGISGMRKGPAGDYVYALQIHTNFRSSPVYGQGGPDSGWEPFCFFAQPGEGVTGLTGTAGTYVHQLGLSMRDRFRHRPTRHFDRDYDRNYDRDNVPYTSYQRVYN